MRFKYLIATKVLTKGFGCYIRCCCFTVSNTVRNCKTVKLVVILDAVVLQFPRPLIIWRLFLLVSQAAFLPNILLFVCVRRWSSAASSVLVEVVALVVEVLLEPRVTLVGKVIDNVPRFWVRVEIFNFLRGIFVGDDFRFDFLYLLMRYLWMKSELGLGDLICNCSFFLFLP